MISQNSKNQLISSMKHSIKNKQVIPLMEYSLEGMKETNKILDRYSDFLQLIHYPDGTRERLPLSKVINKFLDNRTDNLEYYISTELDLVKKEVNIYIIPKVESA